jgi:hypothetical protein
MARRSIGRILATAILLGLVGLVPVVADAASGGLVGEVGVAGAAGTAANPDTTEAPFDPGPLMPLLIAGGLGSMAVLSREPDRDRT